MSDNPFTKKIITDENIILNNHDNHIKRHLSDMDGLFLDQNAYLQMREKEDSVLYEVFEVLRPEEPGELLCGLSVVHPGQVGDEYYMTKGHFHTVLDTAEVYYCLRGTGVMVMETPEGEWDVKALDSGTILYVPPRWAHRSVNTSLDQDLVTFFIYPGHAGHNYGSIAKQGFRKLILNDNGKSRVMDNPRWLQPEDRL